MRIVFSIRWVYILSSLLIVCGSIRCHSVNGQDLNRKGAFFISFNPFKLAMGLVNIEFEYQISPVSSVRIDAEYLVFNYAIKRDKHPDFIVRTGPSIHLLGGREYGDRHDLLMGVDLGYMYSRNSEKTKAFILGADMGYIYQVNPLLLVNPRLIMTYNLSKHDVFPGFECLLGFKLN